MQLLWMVTAFTIGHSLSLALSTLNVVSFPSSVIELLIAVSIAFMALQNLLPNLKTLQRAGIQYSITGGFGLLHGLGFSTMLKAMLGKTTAIAGPLFAFNCGIEAGQLVILTVAFFLFYLLGKLVQQNFMLWRVRLLSLVALGFSVMLIVQRIPLSTSHPS